MTPGEFQALYPHVIGWIRLTLAAHKKNAKSVASVGFVRLPLYFSHELIASTKYVAVTRGKRLVVLVGQKKAIAIAARNVSGRRR